MSIEHATHSGFDPDSHIIEQDGDIKPYDAPLEPSEYVDDFSRHSPQSLLPPEVFSVVYDAATEEDALRTKGVRPERISRLAHIPMNQALVRLALKGIDTSLAFPPVPEAEPEAAQNDFSAREQIEYDHLVDNAGKTTSEAEEIIKSRRSS